MCGPLIIPIAMAAMGAASSIMSTISANAAASAQNAFSAQVSGLNKELALDSANTEYISIGKRITEQEQIASIEIEGAYKESSRLAGFFSTSAGEAGVGGKSIGTLLSDLKSSELSQTSQTIKQLEFDKFAAEQAKQGIQQQTRGRLINGLFIPQQKTGFLQGAIGALGAGASGFTSGVRFNSAISTLNNQIKQA